MALLLLVLLIAIILGGLGFAVHAFWIAALVIFVFWLAGFGFGRGMGAGAGAGRRGWYRW